MKICPACSREYGDEHDNCRDDGMGLVHLDTGTNERAQDLIGKVVDGRYRIERIVGRGGMGTVYACRHVVVGKTFAMKVLRPGIERSEEILQRFIREAQSANAVQSRHICGMTDFGQLENGAFFVVMELLDGMSLTRALREKRLTRKAVKHVFIQIAETLEKAHHANIIHRDLKPDNVVLVNDEGDPHFVKLVDFGIAKMLQSKASNLTETGVILGTPYYMSPEQARGDNIDARSDIYALGVMMYRAFTGKLPFVADTAMGVLTRHLTEKPELPSRVADIDSVLERLILRCLEKKPIDRFQTMADVAAALQGIPDEIQPRVQHPTMDERSGPLDAVSSERHPTPTRVATPQARAQQDVDRLRAQRAAASAPLPRSNPPPRPRSDRPPAAPPEIPPPLPQPPPPSVPLQAAAAYAMPVQAARPTTTSGVVAASATPGSISSGSHTVPSGVHPSASAEQLSAMSSGSHAIYGSSGPIPASGSYDALLPGEAATTRGLSARIITGPPAMLQRPLAWIGAVGAVMLCGLAVAGIALVGSDRGDTPSPAASTGTVNDTAALDAPAASDTGDEVVAPPATTSSAAASASASADASASAATPTRVPPRPGSQRPTKDKPDEDDPPLPKRPGDDIRSPFD